MDFKEAYDDTNTSLGLAARMGNVQVVKELLLAGHPTNGHDNRGWRPLHEAASQGHEECVRLLVMAEDAEIEALTFDGLTALYVAVVGHRAMRGEGPGGAVRALLQAGADPNMSAGDQWCLPLPKAIGNIALVRQLLEGGANPNVEEHEGGTPLHTAVEYGSVEEVALLLSHGAEVTKKACAGQTPLHSLMLRHRSQDEHILDLLLEHKSDVNARDGGGTTPLMLAVQRGWKHGVWKLLECGADVNSTNSAGVLALHFAVEFPKRGSRTWRMSVLDREEVEECNKTDVKEAGLGVKNYEEDTEILEKLLPLTSKELFIPKPFDPAEPLRILHSYSLYHLGVQWGRFKCLKVLIDAGIPADQFLQHVNSSIWDDSEDIKLFRQTAIPVNSGTCVDTPLSFLLSQSLTQKVVDMAKYMIDNGSSVNAVHPTSLPPLVAAVQHQCAPYSHGTPSLEILHYLIHHGADIMYNIRESDILPAALYVSSLFNPAAYYQLLLSGVPARTIYTHSTLVALSGHYRFSWPRFYNISWVSVLDHFIPQLPSDMRLMFEEDGFVDDVALRDAWQELDDRIGSPKTLLQLSLLSVRHSIGEARGWKGLPDALDQLSSQFNLPQTIINLLHFRQINTCSLFHAPSPSAMLLYTQPDDNSSDSSESLVASSFASEPRVEEMDVEEEEEEREEEERVDSADDEEKGANDDEEKMKCDNDGDDEEGYDIIGDDEEEGGSDDNGDNDEVTCDNGGDVELNGDNDDEGMKVDSDEDGNDEETDDEDEKKEQEVEEEDGVSDENKMNKEENVEKDDERGKRKKLRQS